jgi:hypothetical protein
MSDRNYSTWDDAIRQGFVTDQQDGLPDRGIVPLVEELRARGIVTLQSCTGHQGSEDGCLWVRADTVTEASVYKVTRSWMYPATFDFVKLTIYPERRWEFTWRPHRLRVAMKLLARLAASDGDRTADNHDTREQP